MCFTNQKQNNDHLEHKFKLITCFALPETFTKSKNNVVFTAMQIKYTFLLAAVHKEINNNRRLKDYCIRPNKN